MKPEDARALIVYLIQDRVQKSLNGLFQELGEMVKKVEFIDPRGVKLDMLEIVRWYTGELIDEQVERVNKPPRKGRPE